MFRIFVLLVLICTFVIASCNHKPEDSTPMNSSELDTSFELDLRYDIEEFRKCFFITCMQFGYEGDACMDSIINEDVSQHSDFPLGFAGYRAVDSLAREVQKEIVADSIMLMTRRDYEMGKKRVFQICLKHFTSTKIDSVARAVLSKYR